MDHLFNSETYNSHYIFILKRNRTTNGEIGPIADQIYKVWNCTIFVIWVFRRKSKLCIIQKSFIINLYEQQTITFVHLSDLAIKICILHIYHCQYFCTPTPRSKKVLLYKRILWKRSERLWLQKLDRMLGRMWIMNK